MAEDWQGTYPSGVYPTLFGDGWFAGWFVVPWFADGGFYLEAINVDGLIYTTEGFFGLNGMLTANFSYAVDFPANATVTLQYQTCDDGVHWGAWVPYTVPFDPGFLNVRFGVFVAMTGPYHLWVDTFNYSVSV